MIKKSFVLVSVLGRKLLVVQNGIVCTTTTTLQQVYRYYKRSTIVHYENSVAMI